VIVEAGGTNASAVATTGVFVVAASPVVTTKEPGPLSFTPLPPASSGARVTPRAVEGELPHPAAAAARHAALIMERQPDRPFAGTWASDWKKTINGKGLQPVAPAATAISSPSRQT
jgi:hypothetical protein